MLNNDIADKDSFMDFLNEIICRKEVIMRTANEIVSKLKEHQSFLHSF